MSLTKKVVYLVMLMLAVACTESQNVNDKIIEKIFSTEYEQKMISSGDNMPAIYLPSDSLDKLLIALHFNIPPVDFQKYVGWSDSLLNSNIIFLKSFGFLQENNGILEPFVMILPESEAIKMRTFSADLVSKTIQTIKLYSDKIVNRAQSIESLKNHNFDDISLLIMSNVILDNWQIRNIETEFIGKSRTERHEKQYYLSFQEKRKDDTEALGIYGNQMKSYGDYYVGLYGNKRHNKNFITLSKSELEEVFNLSIVEKKDMKSIKAELLDQFYLAITGEGELKASEQFGFELMGMLRNKSNSIPVFTESEYNELFEVAEIIKQPLTSLLKGNKAKLKEHFEVSEYSSEITFEEYLIWWYHVYYTEVTDRLIQENMIRLPEIENAMYLIKKDTR